MARIGIVGYRGLVGSVLDVQMKINDDYDNEYSWIFFSTSQIGAMCPLGMWAQRNDGFVKNANDPKAFQTCDVIVTCQGSDWSKDMYPKIKATGWNGIWLDASSAFRMDDNSIIVLDPINEAMIKQGIKNGIKIFTGGNCTVSLMLLALQGLFNQGVVEWVNTMTYQAASGAGAKYMKELIDQMRRISGCVPEECEGLDLDSAVSRCLRQKSFPQENFGAPLACNALPFIDALMPNGQTREEWKGMAETNKILNRSLVKEIPVDGICVRIGAMRCHSQAITVKLKEDLALNVLEEMIFWGNDWVKIVPNTKEDALAQLTPASVAGTLDIMVGRIRKANFGPEYLTLFTVGDQLLWGAAEPIRRALKIILENL